MILSDAIYSGKRQVKNIIFDWGGVITDLHFDASRTAFHNLGLYIFDEKVPFDPLNKIFIPLEIGTISAGEFRNNLRGMSSRNLTDEMIDRAWNAMLGALPPERWKILESSRQHYRTFLLSNTNVIHLDYYSKYLEGIYGTYGYKHLFEKAYFSFELHMRKPNRDIFEYVLEDSGLKAVETLLIDDSFENVDTAVKIGIQAFHLKKPQTLTDLFTTKAV